MITSRFCPPSDPRQAAIQPRGAANTRRFRCILSTELIPRIVLLETARVRDPKPRRNFRESSRPPKASTAVVGWFMKNVLGLMAYLANQQAPLPRTIPCWPVRLDRAGDHGGGRDAFQTSRPLGSLIPIELSSRRRNETPEHRPSPGSAIRNAYEGSLADSMWFPMIPVDGCLPPWSRPTVGSQRSRRDSPECLGQFWRAPKYRRPGPWRGERRRWRKEALRASRPSSPSYGSSRQAARLGNAGTGASGIIHQKDVRR